MPTETTMPPRTLGTRQTKPEGANPYQSGGLGILANRREADPAYLLGATDLDSLVRRSPLRVLRAMRSSHPTLAQSTENTISLLCTPGGTEVVAIAPKEAGEQDDAADPAGTQALTDLWAGLPPEIGGLDGFLATSLLSLMYTGMACVEAVPGPSGAGVASIWPVEPLTVGFGRDPATSALVPYQRQSGTVPWRKLDTGTFHWVTLDGFVDDPYGEPRYASFLNPGLQDLRRMRDLSDAVAHVAWPRLKFATDYGALLKFAQDPEQGLGLGPEAAREWAIAQIEEQRRTLQSLKSDDTYITDKSTDIAVIQGGAFTGIEGVLAQFDRRSAQGLKTRPVLLGMNDSSTETQATVQWQIEAVSLERLRDRAVSLAVWASSLHLRLKGMALTAKAEYESIRTTEALVEAQAKETEIRNAQELVAMGFMDPDTAAQTLTGSAISDAGRFKAWLDQRSAGGATEDPAARVASRRAQRAKNRQNGTQEAAQEQTDQTQGDQGDQGGNP